MEISLLRISFFTSLLLVLFINNGSAQCSLVKKEQSALFITYERIAKVKTDDGKIHDGVILRLQNNTTCGVIITTGSHNKFYKPLPTNPTVLQRVNREIEYDLVDGVLVSEVQYRYQTSNKTGINVGGDYFFGFNLLGGRSILFEVPFKHVDLSFASRIELPFTYNWEPNSGFVESYVKYWNAALPNDVKRIIKRR